MRQSLIRYLPLLILAAVWEVVARLELVSSTALPPLSDVIAAWIDMIKDGELVTNGASSLYRAGAGLALSVIIGTLLGIGMTQDLGFVKKKIDIKKYVDVSLAQEAAKRLK